MNGYPTEEVRKIHRGYRYAAPIFLATTVPKNILRRAAARVGSYEAARRAGLGVRTQVRRLFCPRFEDPRKVDEFWVRPPVLRPQRRLRVVVN